MSTHESEQEEIEAVSRLQSGSDYPELEEEVKAFDDQLKM